MSALSSLAVLVLLSAPGDTARAPAPQGGEAVLVQFSSQQCTHCRAMEPILARLSQDGCPLQVIDVDQHPDVVKQFRITGVPTYVALAAGRETGRIVGATSYEKLAALFQEAGGKGRASGVGERRSEVGGQRSEDKSRNVQATDYRTPEPAQVAGTGSASAEQAAAAATVRLKVEDAGGFGIGTGTIIDTHDGEALVVTCGHLFRESQGKGKISADLFGAGAGQGVPGQLISYDLDRDIALVSVRVASGVRAAPVAPPGNTVRPGDRVFTIGCDKGRDPSVRPTQITAVNKYHGRPNYTAAGQPVDGRSGGGLFSADGLLIGICNAADPADDEGIYAGLASIHWQLDQIGQSEIYQRTARVAAVAAMPPQQPAKGLISSAAPSEPAILPQMPPQMPSSQMAAATVPLPARDPLTGRAPNAGGLADDVSPVAATSDDAEIVFIVRSKRNPQKQSEVFVVDQAPPDLIARITHAARSSGEQRAALAQARAGGPTMRPAAAYQSAGSPPIVRGQSAD